MIANMWNMNRSPRGSRVAGAFVLALALAMGCSDDDESGGLTGLAPDFSILDVNPNSATFDSTISPRDYLGRVSAWYFGHST